MFIEITVPVIEKLGARRIENAATQTRAAGATTTAVPADSTLAVRAGGPDRPGAKGSLASASAGTTDSRILGDGAVRNAEGAGGIEHTAPFARRSAHPTCAVAAHRAAS